MVHHAPPYRECCAYVTVWHICGHTGQTHTARTLRERLTLKPRLNVLGVCSKGIGWPYSGGAYSPTSYYPPFVSCPNKALGIKDLGIAPPFMSYHLPVS